MKKNKYKILLVVRWPVGGIRTFIRYVYPNFDRNLWQFTILAPEHPEMKILASDLIDLDATFIPIKGELNTKRFYLRLFSLMLNEDFDLIHSHGFTAGMGAAIPAYLKKTPHLMTLHETLNDRQFSGLKGRCKRLCMAWLFRLIDLVHSVSHDAQENLLSFFPSLAQQPGKCIVIPNGIEVKNFLDAEPLDLRGELGLDSNYFLIGFFGRFMSPKGFRYLVDAMELLIKHDNLPKKPVVLTFGAGGFIREENQDIKNRGLHEYFIFMPFTTNVGGTIKGLDVVAMPSISEACPLLPMEALVCGVPLIGTNCIGLRAVLKGTPAILIEKADSISLYKALMQEMNKNTKDAFKKFSELAAKRFDVSSTCKSLEHIYKRLTS